MGGRNSHNSAGSAVSRPAVTPMYESHSDLSQPLSHGSATGRGSRARERGGEGGVGGGLGRFDVFAAPSPSGLGGGGVSRDVESASGVDLFPQPRSGGRGAGSEQERRRQIYSKMELP